MEKCLRRLFLKKPQALNLSYLDYFSKSIRVNDFVYFSKGLLIIVAPLYFHNEETLSIFKLLISHQLLIIQI